MSWATGRPAPALVAPDRGARARGARAAPAPVVRVTRPLPPSTATPQPHRAYPFWARVTAALWLVVLGILVGGAAIPHAQDMPRVVPPSEDARFCKAPSETPAQPAEPVR